MWMQENHIESNSDMIYIDNELLLDLIKEIQCQFEFPSYLFKMTVTFTTPHNIMTKYF